MNPVITQKEIEKSERFVKNFLFNKFGKEFDSFQLVNIDGKSSSLTQEFNIPTCQAGLFRDIIDRLSCKVYYEISKIESKSPKDLVLYINVSYHWEFKDGRDNGYTERFKFYSNAITTLDFTETEYN